jgi:hypothetical protein
MLAIGRAFGYHPEDWLGSGFHLWDEERQVFCAAACNALATCDFTKGEV